MLNLSQTLLTLIKRLERELKEIQEFMNSDDHEEDDDWENTREYYEIAEDELLDQIKCLRSFENFPSGYIGDNKASIVEKLIIVMSERLNYELGEKEIQTLREEIKLLAEILAAR
jgi:DNA-directed RNA polymerase specialized sigma54-like protein